MLNPQPNRLHTISATTAVPMCALPWHQREIDGEHHEGGVDDAAGAERVDRERASPRKTPTKPIFTT
ncbi:hypothetical protein ACIQMR_13960 [Streptomyces sp. NPDC091376]|uniref:hypothetical protein n=1 Tax=Streptomyces sp. NPDC091376 TaxID=3365994 RepID=UPI003830D4DC